MKNNVVIVECSSGHRFIVGKTDDGISHCPRCNGMLVRFGSIPKEGTTGMTRLGDAWRENRKKESRSNQSLSIEIQGDTSILQRQLRAIAKHTEALADELGAIDNAWQCEYCGHDEYVVHDTVHLHDCIHKRCKCAKCDEKCVIVIDDDELPTRLEGSE